MVRARGALLLGLSLLLLAAGCVERRLLVRTDPEGAAIYVDGELRGTTSDQPLAVPFDHYGVRVVVARQDGFVPTRREVRLDPPWYQYFPLGFFTDVLWPGTVADDHTVSLELSRRGEPVDPAELQRAAEHFSASEERRP